MLVRRIPGIVLAHLIAVLALAGIVPSVSASTLFDTVLHFPTGSRPQCVAIGNFDADLNPDPDIVTANYWDNTFSLLRGNGDGTFGDHVDFATGQGPIGIAVADLNHDLKDDIVTVNRFDGTVSVFLGNGDGSFTSRGPFAVGLDPYGIAIGLVDAGAVPDIVVANEGSNSVSVLLGNGDGTFGGRTDFATDPGPRFLVLADLDNNQTLDVAALSFGYHTISVLLGAGNGTFSAVSNTLYVSYCSNLVAGYLDNDSSIDLVTSDLGSTTAVLLGNGDGTFATPVYYPAESNPEAVAMEDLDGNGTKDVAVVNSGQHTVSVYLGDGSGTLANQMSFTAGSAPVWIAVGDLNHDMKQDLVFPNQVNNLVTTLLNTGPGAPVGACCDPATGVCTVVTEVACAAPSTWQGAGTACDPNPCSSCPALAWGGDGAGQCDIPAPNTDLAAIAAGEEFSVGLKSDGSIVAWGDNTLGQCTVPAPNTGFVAVAAGYSHVLALGSDGSIVAWGDDTVGQCDVRLPNANFVAVAGGGHHSLGLKGNGSIVAWGYDGYGQCRVPAPNTGFVAVAAGLIHSLGLKADGSIVAWGDNSALQCRVPSPNTGFVAVAAGRRYSLGLKSDGSIVTWGDGPGDPPAPNMGFVAAAAGQRHGLGLQPDGSIVSWGDNSSGQCDLPITNKGFTAVAAGRIHSLALRCRASHTISATAGPNGSISPSGSVTVEFGGSQTFVIAPDPCYKVVDVLVDNVSRGALTSYTFTNVVTWRSIVAIFGPAGAPTPQRLEAWWTFDDLINSTKMRDLAHYNSGVNAGTLLGVTTTVPGVVGNALACLTPTSGMRVLPAQNSIFIGGSGFAVDAWIYLRSGSNPNNSRMIASTADFRFFVRDRRLCLGAMTGGPQMSEETWHHVAVTLYPARGIGTFYVDGAQVFSFNSANSYGVTEFFVGCVDPISGAGDSFNGYIDEVDVFRASLNGPATDGPTIQKIWAAGCAGKRREFVRLPLWVDGKADLCAVFSNLTAVPQTFDWRLRTLHGPDCGGNLVFHPPGGTVMVPAGGTVIRPVGVNGSGCIRMDITSQTTSSSFFTEAFSASGSQIWAAKQKCIAPPLAPPDGHALRSLRPASVEDVVPSARFILHNDSDEARSIPYRMQGVDGDSGEPTEALRMNGLDWGAPLDQLVQVAAHDSVELDVNVEVDTNSAFQSGQVLLSGDFDGDTTYDPLASELVEASEDSTGAADVTPHGPLPTPTRLTVRPNPFSDQATIRLSLAQTRDLEVAVFDVGGRRVALLHSGTLEAGEHSFFWDARGASGNAPRSGIYFVRVKSPGMERVEKVLRLN